MYAIISLVLKYKIRNAMLTNESFGRYLRYTIIYILWLILLNFLHYYCSPHILSDKDLLYTER